MPASWTESTEVDVVEHRARPTSGEESEQGWLDALAEEQPRLLAGE
jgi:hypothetical protein